MLVLNFVCAAIFILGCLGILTVGGATVLREGRRELADARPHEVGPDWQWLLPIRGRWIRYVRAAALLGVGVLMIAAALAIGATIVVIAAGLPFRRF